jgi:alkaline phosphatase D
VSAAHDPSRRAVLKGAIALATLPSITAFTDRRLGPVRADPFTLGVASGDPSPDGVVIWTRLASNPLADDGFGGMPQRTFDVEWQVAADEKFLEIDQRGFATAAPEFGHSVHVISKACMRACHDAHRQRRSERAQRWRGAGAAHR